MGIPSNASLTTGPATTDAGQPHGTSGLPAVEGATDEPASSGSSSRQHAPNSPLMTSSAIKPHIHSTPSPDSIEVVPVDATLATTHTTNVVDLESQAPPSPAVRFKLPKWTPKLSKRSRLRALFTPGRKVGPPPPYKQSLLNIVKFSPLNILLVFVPVSWAMHWSSYESDIGLFVTSSLAIIPLAALLGFGTEQIAVRTSSAVAGWLNASLGNLVELIIAGIALQHCELALVQSALLGGLLSNLLLVLGMSFIVGGIRFPDQRFQPLAAQINASLLTVGVISLILPTAFHVFLGDFFPDASQEGPMLLKISRASSLILVIIYIAYLGFQFYTHNHLFLDTDTDIDADSSRHASWDGSSASSVSSKASGELSARSRRSSRVAPTATTVAVSEKDHLANDPRIHLADPLQRMTSIVTITSIESGESIHYPKMNVPVALGLLIAITAALYVTAENLVQSLEGLTATYPDAISKEFLSLIVLPILSNAAEHSTAVVVAFKGKFDLVLNVAVGSCIQISLFVIPLLVLVAWGMDKPLSLLFDPLETAALFLSVLLVKFIIEDGKAHWMSGITLVAVYVMISTTFWFFPTRLMGVLGGNHTLFACPK